MIERSHPRSRPNNSTRWMTLLLLSASLQWKCVNSSASSFDIADLRVARSFSTRSRASWMTICLTKPSPVGSASVLAAPSPCQRSSARQDDSVSRMNATRLAQLGERASYSCGFAREQIDGRGHLSVQGSARNLLCCLGLGQARNQQADRRAGPIVLIENDDGVRRKFCSAVGVRGGFSLTEPVDGLIGVSDNDDSDPSTVEPVEECMFDSRAVLKLIDDNLVEPCREPGQDLAASRALEGRECLTPSRIDGEGRTQRRVRPAPSSAAHPDHDFAAPSTRDTPIFDPTLQAHISWLPGR